MFHREDIGIIDNEYTARSFHVIKYIHNIFLLFARSSVLWLKLWFCDFFKTSFLLVNKKVVSDFLLL